MLRVKGISVSYGPVKVLTGISLDVDDDEVLAIVGPNGHGKTTLLKAIAGLIPPSSGEIWFNGGRTDKLSPHEIVKRGIVLLLEGGGYLPNLTVIENLKLGAYTRRDKVKERLEKVYAIFPWLRDRSNQLNWTLSGGERRMLAIARCLMCDSQLLLLDEPTWGIASKVQSEIADVVRRVRSEGRGFLISESNLQFAGQLADRVLLLKNNVITPLDKETISEKMMRYL